MLDTLLLSGLNHLLQGASWAPARLMPFAGRRARFEMPPWHLDLSIAEDGYFLPLAEASHDANSGATAPDVVIQLPADTPFLLPQGLDKVMAVAHVTGNAEFATELSFVFKHLHWDFEEDLAQVLGDIPAHRLVQGAKGVLAWQQQAAINLAENISEYLVLENPLLVANGEFNTLRDDISQFSADLAKLESRLAALRI
jgi:ubiquinone biosynthesis protein UbiJ